MEAGLLGLGAGSALLLGAGMAFFVDVPHRVIAAIMAFGAGVLVAVLSVELMADAYRDGGAVLSSVGIMAGAIVFSGVNWQLSKYGAHHRKRCGDCVQQATEKDERGSGLAIALGAVVDGVPESLIIGLGVAGGDMVGVSVVAGFFLANLPQGLSSSSGMKQAGRRGAYIFGVWGGIAAVSGLAAVAGQALSGMLSSTAVGMISAFAAGGALAMLAETMIPEAFDQGHHFMGIATVTGFVTAFVLGQLSG